MSKDDPMFGGVKIFNERNSAAQVELAISTVRGEEQPANRSARIVVPGGMNFSSSEPVTWSRTVMFPRCIVVSTFGDDGTQDGSFGAHGVGLAGNSPIKNVQVRLVADGVLLTLCDSAWTPLRAAKLLDVPAAQGIRVKCRANEFAMGIHDPDVVDGDALEQIGEGSIRAQWALSRVAGPAVQHQILSSLTGVNGSSALGQWDGEGDEKFAGECNPSSPAVPKNTVFLIEYSDDGGGAYQIVNAGSGLALTSVDTALGTQLRFLPPDSPAPNAQLWDIVGI